MNSKSNNVMSKKIIVGVFLVVILVLFLIYVINANNNYTINLKGSSIVTLYEGDIYYEQGYIAKDKNNKDVTNLVKVNNNVDITKPGSYVITYSINSFFKKTEVMRRVNVIEDPLKDVTFMLSGSNVVDINLGENYQDSGVICSYLNNDCSRDVNITSNVNSNKVGSYTINYKLSIGGKEKELIRNVNVVGGKYEIKLSHDNIVNHDVIINLKSNLQKFSYMILPNGEKSNIDNSSYSVSSNGIYSFVIYDNVGNYENVDVTVSNIDKEKPVASCHSIISSDKKSTSFIVIATDNNKIVKYVHEAFPNNSYQENKFSINRMLEKSYILVYDEASNYTKVECSVEYPYIAPSTQNLVYKYNSETLKYWIEKISSYYVSHIWVKDAYNQMKTALPKFGTLATASDIITSEIRNKSYEKKGMVVVNASGFVSSVYDTRLSNSIPEWKNTAVTPIVIHDGKVLRNFTNRVFPNIDYSVYGLSSDGNLKDYSFPTGSDIIKNTATTDKIINDGVRYTFGFSPVLVKNSQVYGTGNVLRSRNAIGQIDKNNFIIITGRDLSFSILAKKMQSLGCHTAYNLDGGGSVNLFYKGNSNALTSLRKADEKIADTLYFVEK